MPTADLVTPGQIATRFGVHPTTVHRWIEQGLLEVAATTPSTRLITQSEVDRFAATRAEVQA
jgi:excisionase family DNA binding protein